MPSSTVFNTIVPEEKGKMKRIAWGLNFVIFLIIVSGADDAWGTCSPDEPMKSTCEPYDLFGGGALYGSLVLTTFFFGAPIVIFWIYAWYWESKRVIDHHNRVCSNCETTVETSAVVQTNSCEVLGVSESTRAITSSNPVVGVTSSGGHMGVGAATMQSTSYVPVKLGKVKFTVSCPSCSALFSWIENREVVQWTDPSHQVTYEIPGIVTLP